MRVEQSIRSATWARVIFVSYVFVPFAVFFFVPLLFYRIPLRVALWDRVLYANAADVLRALAVCVVWAGVAIGAIMVPSPRSPAGPRVWTPRAVWTSFLVFSIVGGTIAIMHALYVMPAGLEEAVHVASFAPTAAFVLGFVVLRGSESAVPSSSVRAVVIMLMLFDLTVTMVLPALLSAMMPLALGIVATLYGATAIRVPARRLVLFGLALLLLFLAAFPVKIVLREVWQSPFVRSHMGVPGLSQAGTSLERALRGARGDESKIPRTYDLWDYGLRFHRVGGLPPFALHVIERAANRINRLSDLTYVVRTTPTKTPYSGGATYAPLPWKVVPQVLWSRRPPENAGQVYGHKYDLIVPSDLAGSYNLPMVTEGWMSSGWLGIIVSAAFVGILLRVIWWYWIGAPGAPGNLLIGMAVVGTAADMESNLSLVMGGVIHAVVFYWIVDVAVRAWGRRAAARGQITLKPAGQAGGRPPRSATGRGTL